MVTTQRLSAAGYLGVIVTIAGLFPWLNPLRIVPARIAASVQFLQPVFGIAAAPFMFGDKLGPSFVVGVALVLAGLAPTMASRNEAGNRAKAATFAKPGKAELKDRCWPLALTAVSSHKATVGVEPTCEWLLTVQIAQRVHAARRRRSPPCYESPSNVSFARGSGH